VVGCREEELIGLDEEWKPSRFEFRQKVASTVALPLGNELTIPAGAVGEIIKVVPEEDKLFYHVHFEIAPGRVLRIPERLLVEAEGNS
jgi:nitrogen fixation protein NifZ